jgi:hypothetical protein
VNHQLQQLFYFCLEAKGLFFGDSHLMSSFVDQGLNRPGKYWDTGKDFKTFCDGNIRARRRKAAQRHADFRKAVRSTSTAAPHQVHQIIDLRCRMALARKLLLLGEL